MKKRARRWVLYYSRMWCNYYIAEDWKTPIYRLEKLDHFQGLFKSEANAAQHALDQLRSNRSRINAEIRRFKALL